MNGASELFRMGSNMSPNCEKLPDPKITRGTMGKFLYVVLLIEVVLGIFELLFIFISCPNTSKCPGDCSTSSARSPVLLAPFRVPTWYGTERARHLLQCSG